MSPATECYMQTAIVFHLVTYQQKVLHWSDIWRHVNGIYLTVSSYWILHSSQYRRVLVFYEMSSSPRTAKLHSSLLICLCSGFRSYSVDYYSLLVWRRVPLHQRMSSLPVTWHAADRNGTVYSGSALWDYEYVLCNLQSLSDLVAHPLELFTCCWQSQQYRF
jgi:hypothetical protein